MAQVANESSVTNLVINKIPSQAVYASMVTNNQINSNEIYLVDDGDLTAEDVSYSSSVSYSSGTVGDEIGGLETVLGTIDFGNARIASSGQDLDNITTGGCWYFPGANSPSNKPTGTSNYGFLFVFNDESNYVSRLFQLWIDQNSTGPSVWYRGTSTTNTPTFSSWKRLATDADLSAYKNVATLEYEVVT